MTTARSYLFRFAAAMLLASCASPQVAGPAATSLSDNDVREIKLLVSQRSDIKQGVFKIWAERPGHALVQSSSNSYVDAEYSQFTVIKKNGRWRIASPIQQNHLYGTG